MSGYLLRKRSKRMREGFCGWLVVYSARMSERGSDETARGLEQGRCFPLPISCAQSPRGFAALVHLLGRTEKTPTTQAKGRILFVTIVIKLFVYI